MSDDTHYASTHGEIHDWRPPRSQNWIHLKLAAEWRSKTSSLLNGKEPPVPPFQTFVLRNAPASSREWLPVTLNQRRRSSSVPVALSHRSLSTHQPSFTRRHSYSENFPLTHASLRAYGSIQDGPSAEEFMATNRSSSIYSRASDQIDSDHFSWHTSDFADHEQFSSQYAAPSPNISPLRYDQSESPTNNSARLCSPLVPSPSPPPQGRFHSPSSSRSQNSVLLTPLPVSTQVPETSLRAVPLEHTRHLTEAHSEISTPGDLHVQDASDPRLQEVLRFEPGSFSPAETHAILSGPATSYSLDGRRQLLASLRRPRQGSFTAKETQTTHTYSRSSPVAMTVGKQGSKDMTTLTNQSRAESKAKVVQALGLDMMDEPRGRTKRRGPRQMDYSHYIPKSTTMGSDTDESETSSPHQDTLLSAKQYHAVLMEQYRQPRLASPSNTDGLVKKHMRMVPQPLFTNKPLPSSPSSPQIPFGDYLRAFDVDGLKSVRRHRTSQSNTASSMTSIPNSSVDAEDQMKTGNSMKHDGLVTRSGSKRSMQTSGSIPISPPHDFRLWSSRGPSQLSSKTNQLHPKENSDDLGNRASAYYPHVMRRHRKTGSTTKSTPKHIKSDSKHSDNGQTLMLEADIVAQRSSTPEDDDFGMHQQVFSTPPSGRASASTYHSAPSSPTIPKSPVPSTEKKRSIPQRVVENAGRYIDIVRRSPPSPLAHPNPLLSSPVMHEQRLPQTPVTPWPRLMPSRVETQSPHLGWSTEAKHRFDRINSISGDTTQGEGQQHATALQQRPAGLGESSRRDDREGASVGRRPKMVFEQLMEFRREQKAEKRRNELKKMIYVVPPRDF